MHQFSENKIYADFGNRDFCSELDKKKRLTEISG